MLHGLLSVTASTGWQGEKTTDWPTCYLHVFPAGNYSWELPWLGQLAPMILRNAYTTLERRPCLSGVYPWGSMGGPRPCHSLASLSLESIDFALSIRLISIQGTCSWLGKCKATWTVSYLCSKMCRCKAPSAVVWLDLWHLKAYEREPAHSRQLAMIPKA